MENLYKYILITFCRYPRVVGNSVMMDSMLYEACQAVQSSIPSRYDRDVYNRTNAEYLVLVKNGRMLTPRKWNEELGFYLSIEGMGEPVPF